MWRPLDPAPADGQACHLSASTVERWLDQAGATARAGVAEQWVGVESSGHLATDGLGARLRGRTKRVVLALVDTVTGVIWPPVVVAGEGTAAAWESLFARAEQAGLVLRELRGLASDGATGLERYRRKALPWVSHQRRVFQLWRGLNGALMAAGARGTGAPGPACSRSHPPPTRPEVHQQEMDPSRSSPLAARPTLTSVAAVFCQLVVRQLLAEPLPPELPGALAIRVEQVVEAHQLVVRELRQLRDRLGRRGWRLVLVVVILPVVVVCPSSTAAPSATPLRSAALPWVSSSRSWQASASSCSGSRSTISCRRLRSSPSTRHLLRIERQVCHNEREASSLRR